MQKIKVDFGVYKMPRSGTTFFMNLINEVFETIDGNMIPNGHDYQKNWNKAVGVIRDFRDTLASHWRIRNAKYDGDGNVINKLDDNIDGHVDGILKKVSVLEEFKKDYPDALIFKYEDFWDNPNFIFDRLEKYLNVKISSELRDNAINKYCINNSKKISDSLGEDFDIIDKETELHGKHIYTGKPGTWRELIHPKLHKKLNELIKPKLIEHGFMKKVFINRGVFNLELFEQEFEIVKNPEDADYLVCWVRIPQGFEDKLDKIIYIGYEPPLTGPVAWAYNNYDKFHTVFAYYPDTNKDNQFAITLNPIYYPVNPFFENDIIREDISIKNRGIYYSGARCKGMYTNVPHKFGINFKDARDNFAEYLLNNHENSTIIGSGWPYETKKKSRDSSWRITKMRDIEEVNSDFHLCIENYLMGGLVSERLHDGLSSDRVMLYLGDPEIDKYIPTNCYIDLREYFVLEKADLDYNGILNRINSITQEEYDKIIENARRFRNGMSRDGFIKGRDRITKMIIDRIKND